MKKEVFATEDSEDNVHEMEIKNNNKLIAASIKVEKKKKNIKADNLQENLLINKSIPFEEQENIEFILMDFRQPEELNKFKNMKSLSLIQQNISSLKVIEL